MRHTYTSPREKRIDFWVGFTGWFVAYIVVYTVAGIALPSDSTQGSSVGTFDWLYLLLNLAVVIALAFTRLYAALGILAAFATALALIVVEGALFILGAWVASETNNFPSYVAIAFLFMIVGFLPFAVGGFFVLRAVHRRVR